MNIGTPLSASATKVMLLGSGELGKEVIIELQRYGVEVIAVDRYPNAPGHHVAHRAYALDMSDGPALRRLVERERPHIIVPEIEAIDTDMLADIEAEGLAEIIPNAKAAQLTMNREKIRTLAAETLNLPTSRYAFASNLEELTTAVATIGYPCLVKPIMSSSGKGQSSVHQAEDIPAAWDHARHGGRVNQARVIVEEYIDFEYEITLLTVRAITADTEQTIGTYFCDPVGHLQKAGDYVESWQPQIMNAVALAKAQTIAKDITDSLGGRGLFGVELFIKGDDVWFSEVSPRPHDTGMVTMVSQRQSEFALHARAILGLPVDTRCTTPGASSVIYGGLEKKGIAYENVNTALSVPNTEVRLFGKPESFLKRRMGVALAYGDSVPEARQRAKTAAQHVTPIAD